MLRVKEPPTTFLVNRDIATRWARRLAVEFDVGELGFTGEAFVAEKPFQRLFIFWQLGCYGWLVEFTSPRQELLRIH